MLSPRCHCGGDAASRGFTTPWALIFVNSLVHRATLLPVADSAITGPSKSISGIVTVGLPRSCPCGEKTSRALREGKVKPGQWLASPHEHDDHRPVRQPERVIGAGHLFPYGIQADWRCRRPAKCRGERKFEIYVDSAQPMRVECAIPNPASLIPLDIPLPVVVLRKPTLVHCLHRGHLLHLGHAGPLG